MEKPYPINNYDPYRPSNHPYAARFQDLPRSAPTGFTCSETEQFRGHWREFFGARPEQRLHVEIGCYHGESLIEMARRFPDELFVGIEWKFRESYKAAEKALREPLPNLCFLRANVARLPWIFAPGEIDRTWILFPDPWPKLGHHKWRVLHSDFFRALGLLLDTGKEVMIKTDHCDYAHFIGDALAEAGCFSNLDDESAEKIWQDFPPTPFERIFFRKSEPTFVYSLFRNGNLVVAPKPVQAVLAH